MAPPSTGWQAVEEFFTRIGYNFRDPVNHLRANDGLLRAAVSGILEEGATLLEQGERRFREVHVPPSSRSNPFPDAEVMAALRGIVALRLRVSETASRILTLETPGDDQTWRQHREVRTLLEELRAADAAMVEAARAVEAAARTLEAEAIRKRQYGTVENALASVEQAIRDRSGLLSVLRR